MALEEDGIEDWISACPANCSIVRPANFTGIGGNFQNYSTLFDPDHDVITFLEGSRFWIQRVLLPIIVIVGVLGNGKLSDQK